MDDETSSTMLDDASWFQPFVETWTRQKLPWAVTGAARSYSTQPDVAEYAALTAAYQRHGARPPRAR